MPAANLQWTWTGHGWTEMSTNVTSQFNIIGSSIVEDGVTGKLFPYGDSDAMLNALSHLNRDREYGKTLGIAARQRALHHFTQERFLQQVRQFYVDVAGALPTTGSRNNISQSSAPYTLETCEPARSWGTHDA